MPNLLSKLDLRGQRFLSHPSFPPAANSVTEESSDSAEDALDV